MSAPKEFYIKTLSNAGRFKDYTLFDYLFRSGKRPLTKEKVAHEYIGLEIMRLFAGEEIIVPKAYIVKNQSGAVGIASKVESKLLEEFTQLDELENLSTNPSYTSKITSNQIATLDVVGAFLGNFETIGICLQNIRYDNKTNKLYKFDESEAIRTLYRPWGWRIADFSRWFRIFNLFTPNYILIKVALLPISIPLILLIMGVASLLSNNIFNYYLPKFKSLFVSLNDSDIEKLNNYSAYYYYDEGLNRTIEDGKSLSSLLDGILFVGPQLPINVIYKSKKLKANDIKESLKKLLELNNEALFLMIDKVPNEILPDYRKAEVFDLLMSRRNLMFRKYRHQLDEEYTKKAIYETHPWLYTPNIFEKIANVFKGDSNSYWAIQKKLKEDPLAKETVLKKLPPEFQKYLQKDGNVLKQFERFQSQEQKARENVRSDSEAVLYHKIPNSNSQGIGF